ncbi:hypothetical protein [Brevibacillus reuszeri]|uniref:hypothetical protein n=1 Tax=Brevibacillus reuszeri TaxID=54915 RepID=UPI003D20BC9E
MLSQLDYALRQWVTTFRGHKESINREDVYEILSMRSQELAGEHMLVPPAPFFPSRLQFFEDLANNILTGSHQITFLTGLPGQGKKSVVSALANRRDPVIDLRYLGQLHRQHFLQRWVCSRETLEKIQSELDVVISTAASVNVRTVRS